MRQAAFTNRALVALLAAFVASSALGQSPEPSKVRITTWNLNGFRMLRLLMRHRNYKHNEALNVVAVCVNDPDCPPITVHS